MSEMKDDVKGLDDDMGESNLILVSAENEKVTVLKKVALMSELVKTMSDGGNKTNSNFFFLLFLFFCFWVVAPLRFLPLATPNGL